jgi:hypothetical protein
VKNTSFVHLHPSIARPFIFKIPPGRLSLSTREFCLPFPLSPPTSRSRVLPPRPRLTKLRELDFFVYQHIYLPEHPLISLKKFVTGLATLQDAIQSVSNAYIKHTNAVLGEHGSGFDIDSALLKISENPILGNLNVLAAASGAAAATAAAPQAVAPAEPAAPDKKERKKRQHDPHAPKRPLTPFFLYMQTARPIIAKDLGEKVAKGDVSTEGTKRWTEMAAKDKAVSLSMHNYSSATLLIYSL